MMSSASPLLQSSLLDPALGGELSLNHKNSCCKEE